jgi:hypothetical protein
MPGFRLSEQKVRGSIPRTSSILLHQVLRYDLALISVRVTSGAASFALTSVRSMLHLLQLTVNADYSILICEQESGRPNVRPLLVLTGVCLECITFF